MESVHDFVYADICKWCTHQTFFFHVTSKVLPNPCQFPSSRLCDPLDTSKHLDAASLFSNLAGNFEGVVQYNKDNRAFEV